MSELNLNKVTLLSNEYWKGKNLNQKQIKLFIEAFKIGYLNGFKEGKSI